MKIQYDTKLHTSVKVSKDLLILAFILPKHPLVIQSIRMVNCDKNGKQIPLKISNCVISFN